jgi:hypothetical protein
MIPSLFLEAVLDTKLTDQFRSPLDWGISEYSRLWREWNYIDCVFGIPTLLTPDYTSPSTFTWHEEFQLLKNPKSLEAITRHLRSMSSYPLQSMLELTHSFIGRDPLWIRVLVSFLCTV